MIQAALNSEELDWKRLDLKKNDFLIRKGEIEKHIYYIVKGAVRAFSIIEENEKTIRFGYTNSIINSLSSYLTSKPSELGIQALRKTTILQCSKTSFETYVNATKERLSAYNTILNESIVGLIEREIDLMHTKPTNRIKRLQKRSPQLFQEVPHKYIAAYLKMSPETLSRLLNCKM